MQSLEGESLADPRILRFTTGRRRKAWNRNCIAIGLAGGFLEPLESTSIHLIQSAIGHLIELFPDHSCDPVLAGEYNRLMDLEFERVRDLLVLHYHATQRDDSALWNYCRTMSIPDSLQYRLELFRERGHVVTYKDGLFLEPSWLAVFLGQGIVPRRHDPLADVHDLANVSRQLDEMHALVKRAAIATTSHADFIRQYCAMQAS
jgi:tryptophan halogenase